jgi:hypothetical protein
MCVLLEEMDLGGFGQEWGVQGKCLCETFLLSPGCRFSIHSLSMWPSRKCRRSFPSPPEGLEWDYLPLLLPLYLFFFPPMGVGEAGFESTVGGSFLDVYAQFMPQITHCFQEPRIPGRIPGHSVYLWQQDWGGPGNRRPGCLSYFTRVLLSDLT